MQSHVETEQKNANKNHLETENMASVEFIKKIDDDDIEEIDELDLDDIIAQATSESGLSDSVAQELQSHFEKVVFGACHNFTRELHHLLNNVAFKLSQEKVEIYCKKNQSLIHALQEMVSTRRDHVNPKLKAEIEEVIKVLDDTYFLRRFLKKEQVLVVEATYSALLPISSHVEERFENVRKFASLAQLDANLSNRLKQEIVTLMTEASDNFLSAEIANLCAAFFDEESDIDAIQNFYLLKMLYPHLSPALKNKMIHSLIGSGSAIFAMSQPRQIEIFDFFITMDVADDHIAFAALNALSLLSAYEILLAQKNLENQPPFVALVFFSSEKILNKVPAIMLGQIISAIQFILQPDFSPAMIPVCFLILENLRAHSHELSIEDKNILIKSLRQLSQASGAPDIATRANELLLLWNNPCIDFVDALIDKLSALDHYPSLFGGYRPSKSKTFIEIIDKLHHIKDVASLDTEADFKFSKDWLVNLINNHKKVLIPVLRSITKVWVETDHLFTIADLERMFTLAPEVSSLSNTKLLTKQ